MKRWLFRTLLILALLFVWVYAGACMWFYEQQESLVFLNPKKLALNYLFTFDEDFEEINFTTTKDITLNALLFKTKYHPSKGVIYNLHGAGGNISNKNEFARIFTDKGYDFFTFDYRGYGKSNGNYHNESELYHDTNLGYRQLLKRGYKEHEIIVLGVSLGTGLASHVAANNKPKHLVLVSPYYNLPDMANHLPFPSLKFIKYLPTNFLLNYKLNNQEHIKQCQMPITIFHGTDDKLIYFESSLKLKRYLKPTDTLIAVKGGKHDGFSEHEVVVSELKTILD